MSRSVSWQQNYKDLVAWMRSHQGSTCVPKTQGRLGRWVARQRELHKSGRILKSRAEKLADIGLIWSVAESEWNEKFEALKKWTEVSGHANVPISHKHIGSWVSKQRQNYKRGKLSLEKYRKLSSIGFVWHAAEAEWASRFHELCKWKIDHGHLLVPFTTGPLGWWVNTQRQNRRKNVLREDRRKSLDDIGFVWSPASLEQEKSFKTGEAHVKEADRALHARRDLTATSTGQQRLDQFVQCISGDEDSFLAIESCTFPTPPPFFDNNSPLSAITPAFDRNDVICGDWNNEIQSHHLGFDYFQSPDWAIQFFDADLHW